MAAAQRLIDANALTDIFVFLRKMWSGTEIMAVIDEATTVDAVEVVHGRWKQTGMHLLPYECSVCGSEEEGRTNYCPNCGARMDLEAI